MAEAAAPLAGAGKQAPWDVEELQRLLSPAARSSLGSVGMPPPGLPLIALTAGVPDAASFPIDAIGDAVRTVLEREPVAALEYLAGAPQGVPELRRLVVDRMEPEPGLSLTEANVTITSGAAQALENIFRTFLDAGDPVIVEAPSYRGALGAIRGAGGEPVTVPIDEHGIHIDLLEQRLIELERGGRRAKAIYVMPTFQNPSGVTMPLERRRQLVELAARHRVLIVEDDAYGELRFEGETVPSLFSVARGVGVLRCGTVSKTIAPGLRVAWVKGQAPLITSLVKMRFDNGTSAFTQRIVRAYVESGAFEPHIAEMRDLYRRKFEAMDAALGEHLSRFASWTEPEGGFYVWVKLPEGVDCVSLQETAWDEGVGYFLGTAFYPDGGGRDYLRLAYSNVSIEQIGEGCARLGRALARGVAAKA